MSRMLAGKRRVCGATQAGHQPPRPRPQGSHDAHLGEHPLLHGPHPLRPGYAGSGRPFVSGISQMITAPTR